MISIIRCPKEAYMDKISEIVHKFSYNLPLPLPITIVEVKINTTRTWKVLRNGSRISDYDPKKVKTYMEIHMYLGETTENWGKDLELMKALEEENIETEPNFEAEFRMRSLIMAEEINIPVRFLYPNAEQGTVKQV